MPGRTRVNHYKEVRGHRRCGKESGYGEKFSPVGGHEGRRRRHLLSCANAALTALAGAPDSPDHTALLPDTATHPETPPTAAGFDNCMTGGWAGERQRLQDAGLTLGATLTVEGFYNFMGGIESGHPVASTTADFSLALDTDKLLHWHGGEFYADLEDHAFRDPSTALVGDLQVFDKQNSAPYLQIFEIWYQQKLFEDKLRIKIGKVDANTEFSVVDNGLPFLGSSSQVSPTIFIFPTTPDPMPSVDAFFTPNETWYASAGAYYANRSDEFGDLVDDPAAIQRSDYGVFLIGETGLNWHAAPLFEQAGNLKLGAWEHNGTFTRLDGSQQQGTYGGYAILDQTLWQPKGEPPTAGACGRSSNTAARRTTSTPLIATSAEESRGPGCSMPGRPTSSASAPNTRTSVRRPGWRIRMNSRWRRSINGR